MTLTEALEPTGSPEPASPLHVPALTTGCWLDGAPVDAAGRSLPLVDPTTGQPAGEVRCASPEQVEAALAGARAARRGWRTTAPGERAAALRAAAASVRDHADVLGDLLVATTGRLVGQARGSAAVAAELLEEAATTGVLDAGRSLAGSSGAIDVVRREPRGTVAVITPWNDPFPAAAGLLAAALVAGNTVVHKPSERSSGPGAAMAALIAAALPPGVLQVVTGDGEVGEALVADDRVDVVAQVGSTATGRRIGAVAGARGAVALLENGGKDPLLVDAGVDPAWAAAQVAAGAFTNSGQLCTSVERVYLHADVADAVLAELVELARGLVVADPADPDSQLGPLVDERQLAVVSAHVEAALAAGAQALAGGERLDRPGAWYPPTVLVGCTDDMDVMTEETFGPVAAVRVVGSWEEGLRLAGSGAYGLAATVLTPDTAHALQAADELEVGTVKVNAVWGGAPGGSADPRRSSGRGRGYGPDLLGELTALKAVHLEPAPPVRR